MRDGLKTEAYLHEAMRSFVDVNTTFEELFYCINDQIKALGYANLDFLGNLGYSIVKDKRQRIYIEKGNYGFKKENIYRFNGGVLTELYSNGEYKLKESALL